MSVARGHVVTGIGKLATAFFELGLLSSLVFIVPLVSVSTFPLSGIYSTDTYGITQIYRSGHQSIDPRLHTGDMWQIMKQNQRISVRDQMANCLSQWVFCGLKCYLQALILVSSFSSIHPHPSNTLMIII